MKLEKTLLLMIVLMIAACSQTPVIYPEAKSINQDEGLIWYQINIQLVWPDELERPHFYYDALLADQVFKPILFIYRDEIKLWRFHRRAARDAAGHKFSLWLYTSSAAFNSMKALLFSDDLLLRLEDGGIVKRVSTRQYPAENKQFNLAQTSDKQWPEEIQLSWPYFIMGVSQQWLLMIDQFSSVEKVNTDNIDDLLSHYDSVNQAVATQWQRYGAHAFLHHLNALYGYENFWDPRIEQYQRF